jgi:hypothetical protein
MVRRIRPLTVILATAVLVAIANWVAGPRLFPHGSIAIAEVMLTVGVASLLVFGTIFCPPQTEGASTACHAEMTTMPSNFRWSGP